MPFGARRTHAQRRRLGAEAPDRRIYRRPVSWPSARTGSGLCRLSRALMPSLEAAARVNGRRCAICPDTSPGVSSALKESLVVSRPLRRAAGGPKDAGRAGASLDRRQGLDVRTFQEIEPSPMLMDFGITTVDADGHLDRPRRRRTPHLPRSPYAAGEPDADTRR